MELILGTQYSAGIYNGLYALDVEKRYLDKIISNLLESQVDIIDTAPIYGRLESEIAIGKSSWNRNVWTKVGVCFENGLPKLDYSVEGMFVGLQDSLSRLKRSKLDTVFIHNPSVGVLRNLDFSTIRQEWIVDLKMVSKIGLALHSDTDLEYLLEGRIPEVSVIMVELPNDKENWNYINELSKTYKIAIRGIFHQGKIFEGGGKYPDIIRDRVAEIKDALDPDYLVLAPRTYKQSLDYKNVWK